MPSRPEWYDEHWKNVDKATAKKIRTTCPRCGSDKTYYNAKFKVWRCGACEHSFSIKGVRGGRPWWDKLMFWRK